MRRRQASPFHTPGGVGLKISLLRILAADSALLFLTRLSFHEELVHDPVPGAQATPVYRKKDSLVWFRINHSAIPRESLQTESDPHFFRTWSILKDRSCSIGFQG